VLNTDALCILIY